MDGLPFGTREDATVADVRLEEGRQVEAIPVGGIAVDEGNRSS
jgi:hypothetical protein